VGVDRTRSAPACVSPPPPLPSAQQPMEARARLHHRPRPRPRPLLHRRARMLRHGRSPLPLARDGAQDVDPAPSTTSTTTTTHTRDFRLVAARAASTTSPREAPAVRDERGAQRTPRGGAGVALRARWLHGFRSHPPTPFIYIEVEREEERARLQSQCHAGSGLTCRSSSLGCSPTTQGPVRDQYMNPNRAHRKASFATAPAPCAAPTHGAEWGEIGHPTPRAHHARGPFPVVVPSRHHQAAASGYKGLRWATQIRPRARHHTVRRSA